MYANTYMYVRGRCFNKRGKEIYYLELKTSGPKVVHFIYT